MTGLLSGFLRDQCLKAVLPHIRGDVLDLV